MSRVLVALALTLVAGCRAEGGHGASRTAPAPPAAPAPSVRRAPVLDAAGLTAYRGAHRGRPLLVNVFASWCEPCRAELPDLAALAQRAPRLQLLGIDADQDAEAANGFAPRVPSAIEVVRAPDGVGPLLIALALPDDWNRSFPRGWEKNIPLTFLYDAQGAFVTGSVGQLSAEALREIATASR